MIWDTRLTIGIGRAERVSLRTRKALFDVVEKWQGLQDIYGREIHTCTHCLALVEGSYNICQWNPLSKSSRLDYSAGGAQDS